MMKNIFSVLMLLFSAAAIAQEGEAPQINAQLPHVVPPSPTVASLMKFEEYPVNNYTGIPDISIPIYSVSTIDNGLSINIGLSYHPGSAGGDAIASNTGLGWSLMAGGSISRTVRGMADEFFDGTRYGIHRSENKYEQTLAMIGTGAWAADSPYYEYLWEANEKGKYDTEYDLYQYNFMGHSGRFFINKALQVVKLDNNTLKITYFPGLGSFNITDDNGNIFRFNIQETSTETSWSNSHFHQAGAVTTASTSQQYVSAYHLSTVNSKTGQELINFTYSAGESETVSRTTTTRSEMQGTNINGIINILTQNCTDLQGALQRLEPETNVSISSVAMVTKKLTAITIIGKAKIDFVNTTGRSDYNLDTNGGTKLQEIVINKYLGTDSFEEFKRFTLDYFNSNVAGIGSRLMLESVVESNPIDQIEFKHLLSYNNYYETLGLDNISTDYWGYFNDPSNIHGRRETSTLLCKTDILQKIVYPTGGCAIFDFESNNYSYVGRDELTNFDTNPDNFIVTDMSNIAFSLASDGRRTAFLSLSLTPGCFHVLNPPILSQSQGIQLFKLVNSNWELVGEIAHGQPGEALRFPMDTGYKLIYTNFNGYGNGMPGVPYKIECPANPTRKWLYGGGVRIKQIGYFDNGSVDKDYYNRPYPPEYEPLPAREKHYNYNFFDDAWQSSGALVSQKPVFEYVLNRKHGIVTCGQNGTGPVASQLAQFSFRYKFFTSKAGAPGMQSQGGYVGYKNVRVFETGNGRTDYTYDSPIDVLEDDPQMSYPFFPKATHDYKKGSLRSQIIYDNNLKKLVETNYIYDPAQIVESSVVTGMKIVRDINCPFSGLYAVFANYMSAFYACDPPNNIATCTRTCGSPEALQPVPLLEYVGWKKLTGKTTKEYFYATPTATATTVETSESYQYNTLNHRLSHTEKTIYSGTNTEIVSADYEYYLTPGYATNNRISDLLQIKNYKNGEIISTKKINYNTPRASNYLPLSIAESKGNRPLEEKVEFLKYDTYGRPIMLKQTEGLTVCIIYGYNRSQPIAKIENATYESIATALGITEADLSAYTEANLPSLNGLRNILPFARITTFTYAPILGVTSVTDPKGDVTSYEYDSFGRLKFVFDTHGKTLSKNEYHYKTE